MQPKSRSPLKHQPARLPGQSLQDSITNLVFDIALPYLMSAILLTVLAVNSWLSLWQNQIQAAWTFTILAVASIALCTWRCWGIRKKVEQLRRGRDGERAVAQLLEGLRVHGARIFHDIPAPGFNLDHVILSPRGLFVVETKTHTKPRYGEARVTLVNDEVRLGGYAPSRNPISQTQAAARWLSEFLEESTGTRYPVRGVVVYPGWRVDRMTLEWRRNPELPWVLAPRALPKFFERCPKTIPLREIAFAAKCLAQHARSVAAI